MKALWDAAKKAKEEEELNNLLKDIKRQDDFADVVQSLYKGRYNRMMKENLETIIEGLDQVSRILGDPTLLDDDSQLTLHFNFDSHDDLFLGKQLGESRSLLVPKSCTQICDNHTSAVTTSTVTSLQIDQMSACLVEEPANFREKQSAEFSSFLLFLLPPFLFLAVISLACLFSIKWRRMCLH